MNLICNIPNYDKSYKLQVGQIEINFQYFECANFFQFASLSTKHHRTSTDNSEAGTD